MWVLFAGTTSLPDRGGSESRSKVGQQPQTDVRLSSLRNLRKETVSEMPPKRGAQPQRPASTPPPNVVEPEELSPNLTYLRTHSKWAAVCQYLITFMPAIGVPDYTVQVNRAARHSLLITSEGATSITHIPRTTLVSFFLVATRSVSTPCRHLISVCS